MLRRSRAREVALQLLVESDVNPAPERTVTERFVVDRLREPAPRSFALALLDGATAHKAEIDLALAAAATNWRVPRMAVVDRNVLRLAAYELHYTPETPAAVVIDEAIELARRFGSAESPSFVNGVLDRLRQNLAPSA